MNHGTDPIFFHDGPERPQRPVWVRVALVAALAISAALAGSVAVNATDTEAQVITALYDDVQAAVNPKTDVLGLIDEALLAIGEMAPTASTACTDFLGITANLLAVQRAYWFVPGYTPAHEAMQSYGPGIWLWEDEDTASFYAQAQSTCQAGL